MGADYYKYQEEISLEGTKNFLFFSQLVKGIKRLFLLNSWG